VAAFVEQLGDRATEHRLVLSPADEKPDDLAISSDCDGAAACLGSLDVLAKLLAEQLGTDQVISFN
jgi:hypothetical protein